MQSARTPRGFTMLELIMAMAVFSMLGTMVVYMMRQGMNVFTAGTQESALQDRTETILPTIVNDLEALALPVSFDPPAPQPSEEDILAGMKPVEVMPEWVRLRSGWIKLRDVPDGPLKDIRAYYMAWVTDVSEDRSDPWLRRAGERSGPGLQTLEPNVVDRATVDTALEPTGGLREICYVAVAEDPNFPGVMTLYQGWRSPVGGEGTLLDPNNLSTRRAIREACRPVERGVLHLEARWRRVFASGWRETTSRRVGERDSYVGAVWDSTRALDPKFPLFAGEDSLGDPSDDLFPASVRVEVVLVAPSALGFGRGETQLVEPVGTDDDVILVENAAPLVGPGPSDRYLKVGGEWMRYSVLRVDARAGKIPVERAQRGTVKASHDTGAEVYVGLSSRRMVRLLYRDRFAQDAGRRGSR